MGKLGVAKQACLLLHGRPSISSIHGKVREGERVIDKISCASSFAPFLLPPSEPVTHYSQNTMALVGTFHAAAESNSAGGNSGQL